MKKYISLLILFSSTLLSKGQSPTLAIRNHVLGIYSGTYLDYATWPDFDTLTSGVKMTALPNDTSGIIFNDTINNIVDTLHVVFTYTLPNMVPDTFLDNCCNNLAGEYNPARDSIFLSYYPQDVPANPAGEFILKCIDHTFPTSIKEFEKPLFNIYPNPVIDKLYITTSSVYNNYLIYDLYGQIIKTGTSSSYIDVSSLPNGVYYIRLNGKPILKPFIKTY